MCEGGTAGQRAHRAFWAEMRGAVDASDWEVLTAADHAWWEAIAEATIGEGNVIVRAADLHRLLGALAAAALTDDEQAAIGRLDAQL